jgi:hypothetical protein
VIGAVRVWFSRVRVAPFGHSVGLSHRLRSRESYVTVRDEAARIRMVPVTLVTATSALSTDPVPYLSHGVMSRPAGDNRHRVSQILSVSRSRRSRQKNGPFNKFEEQLVLGAIGIGPRSFCRRKYQEGETRTSDPITVTVGASMRMTRHLATSTPDRAATRVTATTPAVAIRDHVWKT